VANLEIEGRYEGLIAGMDEAGRGPWAGPVVAAAALFLDPSSLPSSLLEGVHDSKTLTKGKREALYKELIQLPKFSYGIGVGSIEEIDRLNILKATFLSMERAMEALPQRPDVLLIDGKYIPSFMGINCIPIIKGDQLSLSIAAASILAKVTRDGLMEELGRQYPAYGWEKNAGYGTPQHQKALKTYGITPHHRRSFAPIKVLIQS
jgi:ribonuclease HII